MLDVIIISYLACAQSSCICLEREKLSGAKPIYNPVFAVSCLVLSNVLKVQNGTHHEYTQQKTEEGVSRHNGIWKQKLDTSGLLEMTLLPQILVA